MKEALKILESNNLYRHLILFKLYVESNGNTNYQLKFSLLTNDIKQLFGEDFNPDFYGFSRSYLVSKGYTNQSTTTITHKGIDYFENWIQSFKNLTDEELESIEKSLPEPIFNFFKFTKGTTTVLGFINQILKIAERF